MKSITQTVEEFIERDHTPKEDGRYLSWDYCYGFFKNYFGRLDWEHGSLMLAFYLASWGMYRGSSFLFQYTFTVHEKALQIIFSPKYDLLRFKRILSPEDVPLLFELIRDLKEYYFEKNKQIHSSIVSPNQVSDTLISKILLGVLGNIPAYDTYAKVGLKELGLSQTMSEKGYLQLLKFYEDNKTEINVLSHTYKYPIMKIIDMYLWDLGFNLSFRVY